MLGGDLKAFILPAGKGRLIGASREERLISKGSTSDKKERRIYFRGTLFRGRGIFMRSKNMTEREQWTLAT